MSFFASYPSSGGGGGAVDSVNGQTGVVVLDSDDIAQGSTNLYYTTADADAKADVDLSNLAPTAINVDLVHGTPDTDWTIRTANNGAGNSGDLVLRSGTATGTRGGIQLAADVITVGDIGSVQLIAANGGILGSAGQPFSAMLTTVSGIYAGGGQFTFAAGPIATPSGASVNGTINTHANSGFTIFSTPQAGNTGPLALETGNSSSFASGDIVLRIGTANTTQGNIKLIKAGVAATIGHVWTATNADGSGYWAAPSGGGANTALSNLASVNLNANLTTTKASDLEIRHQAVGSDRAILVATANNGAGHSGGISLQTGSANNDSGQISISTSLATLGQAGPITIAAGSSVSGNGGYLQLNAGSSVAGQPGGAVSIQTGSGSAGGQFSVITGAGDGTDANSGTIYFQTGFPSGAGFQGPVDMTNVAYVQMASAAADPTNPALVAGAMFYDNVVNKLKVYNGATWETVTSV